VEGVIDNCALMPAERSDPVARAKEREIALHYLIEQRGQIGLYSTLRCGLGVLRVARLKRPSTQDDSGPLIKINRAELVLLQSKPSQPSFVEATESKDGGVLVVGGNIIGANPEQQEGFHVPHPTRSDAHCALSLSKALRQAQGANCLALAAEDLGLLSCKLLLSQYTGCFELPKLLKLGKHVGFRRCLRLWRRGRRRVCLLWRGSLLLLVRFRISLLLILFRPPISLAP
jgi:hypothetical protein